MKIRRLDLIAYGPFVNEALEFEADNLHLIYGPNEAGKSTALRALQAVLYGMTDKRDAFLHPWDLMRVGMSIETGNGLIKVERRKGKGVRSLLYVGTERPVSGEEWARVLPVLDQNLFMQMFGLDYQRLVEGGRELAQGKGDIGEALLAAAGDLGSAVQRMHTFQDRAAELFQAHARSQSKLSVALRQYKDADKRIRSERFSSHAYRTAVLELEEKQRECERFAGEIRTCAGEHQALTRLQQAAPGVALLMQKQGELEAVSAIVLLPADFAARHDEVRELLRKALTTGENSQAELERLTQKLADTPRDPELAGLSVEIESLFAQSGKIDAAREHQPRREGQVRELTERAKRNLRQLGLERDPAECAGLKVKVVQRTEIDRLTESYPSLIALLGEAKKNLQNLSESLDENQQDLQELPPTPDTAELERCLAGVAGTPSEKDIAKSREQAVAAEMRADADLKALPLFRGTGDQLQQLQTPLAATVRVYQTRYAQQDALERQLEAEEAQARTDLGALEQKMRQLEDRGEVPTERGLDDSRARRDLGWTAVKHRWLEGEADAAAETQFLSGASSGRSLDQAYEDAVDEADGIADRLRREADRVQKKALCIEQIAAANQKSQELMEKIGQAATAREVLEGEWRSAWVATSHVPFTPIEMLDWLEARRDVIEALRNAAALKADLSQAEAQLQTWRAALEAALAPFGISVTGVLAEVIQAAREIVERANKARTRRRDLENEHKRLRSEQAKAAKRRSELQESLDKWQAEWASAIQDLPVPAGAMPDAVQAVVDLLDEIAAAAEQINGLVHRIETMRRDDGEYSTQVEKIAARSGTGCEDTDSLIIIKKLHHAATAAKQNEDAAANLRNEIERTREALENARLEAERQRKRLSALCAEASVDTPDSLRTAIESSNRKRELAIQIGDQKKALAAACAGRTIEELVEAVGALDLDALPARLRQLEERQQSYERQKQECSNRTVELERDFQLHESAATLIQAAVDKQDAAARILDLGEQYLEQEIAGRLLGAAVERYRRRHQDPMLDRAGQYFKTLTCGSFSALTVDFDESNRRVLRAVRNDSAGHVDVAGLSDGARDQLFFSLRLAYIEDHCARLGKCPVILDDVLMAFDNDRAAAALRVLGELAAKTQVLLFTHHAHHIDLARRALGEASLTVHELAPAQVAVS